MRSWRPHKTAILLLLTGATLLRVLAEYAVWVAGQPLSARTRERYVAAVRPLAAWLEAREGGPGHALATPRGRDLAVRDYKRQMKVDRGLAAASVNQALAALDHLFRFLGLGAAIVSREELPRAAPRALDVEQQRALLRAAEESSRLRARRRQSGRAARPLPATRDHRHQHHTASCSWSSGSTLTPICCCGRRSRSNVSAGVPPL